jgi:hypothetical protein
VFIFTGNVCLTYIIVSTLYYDDNMHICMHKIDLVKYYLDVFYFPCFEWKIVVSIVDWVKDEVVKQQFLSIQSLFP